MSKSRSSRRGRNRFTRRVVASSNRSGSKTDNRNDTTTNAQANATTTDTDS